MQESCKILEKRPTVEPGESHDDSVKNPRVDSDGRRSTSSSHVLLGSCTTDRRGQRKKRRYMPFQACCSGGGCQTTKMPAATESLNPLITVEPEGVNSVDDEEWVKVEVAVDSGATETVMPEATLLGVIDIVEGNASKRGVAYEVADGNKIPNLGERKFLAVSEEGVQRGMTAQVAAINKMLMSVSKVARKGNRVVFDSDGSYIEDKASGERTWMRESGGMYYIDMWVSRKSSAEAGF